MVRANLLLSSHPERNFLSFVRTYLWSVDILEPNLSSCFAKPLRLLFLQLPQLVTRRETKHKSSDFHKVNGDTKGKPSFSLLFTWTWQIPWWKITTRSTACRYSGICCYGRHPLRPFFLCAYFLYVFFNFLLTINNTNSCQCVRHVTLRDTLGAAPRHAPRCHVPHASHGNAASLRAMKSRGIRPWAAYHHRRPWRAPPVWIVLRSSPLLHSVSHAWPPLSCYILPFSRF